jgi:UDP-N-acetylmuramate--alanine ligase
MKPTIAVVTNIDREHLDYYEDLNEIRDAFVRFLSSVPFYGAAIVCVDDANVRSVLPRVDRKVITYGLSSDAEVMASDVEISGFVSSFKVQAGGRELGRVRLPLPGRHAVYNGLAAIAVGLELDVGFRTIANALKGFRGVDRRLQHRGKTNGATVLDDYGHHPTEIAATLAAVREGFGVRTVVLFQPHRYSRTHSLLEEFGGAFFLADHVIVTDVYPAGETPIAGVDGSIVADALVRHGHPSVVYEPRMQALPKLARQSLRDGDILLTLGAGDIWKVGDSMVRAAARGAKRKKSAPRRKR